MASFLVGLQTAAVQQTSTHGWVQSPVVWMLLEDPLAILCPALSLLSPIPCASMGSGPGGVEWSIPATYAL